MTLFFHFSDNCLLNTGMDISTCNLVIRFDKPPNFSSYLQSKGRARAENAKYVLLHDEPNVDAYSKNKDEYDNYKHIERVRKSVIV